MRRMGAVTPPPAMAGPVIKEPSREEEPVPAIPDVVGPPPALPGAPMATPNDPGGKPPGTEKNP
jgi:hypothetical protein